LFGKLSHLVLQYLDHQVVTVGVRYPWFVLVFIITRYHWIRNCHYPFESLRSLFHPTYECSIVYSAAYRSD